MQDLIDRCLSSKPSVRPTLDDLQDSLSTIRDSIASHTSSSQQQTLPQHTSPQQTNPPEVPSGPQPGGGVRQVVSRSRIKATQQQPHRRQRFDDVQQPVAQQANVSQSSNPHRTGSQADRIPADWGRVSKLETKRSARLMNAPATAPATASADAAAVDPAPAAAEMGVLSSPEVAGGKLGSSNDSSRTPCLQQLWRTVGFCYVAKQTQSFMEENKGVSGEGVPAAEATSVAPETPIVTEGVNAGGKKGNLKMSLRVKRLFTNQSKQIKQCMVCK